MTKLIMYPSFVSYIKNVQNLSYPYQMILELIKILLNTLELVWIF